MAHQVISGFLIGICCVLTGCGNSNEAAQHEGSEQRKVTQEKIKLKPAVKLGTDASGVARATHNYLQTVNIQAIEQQPEKTDFEQQVYKPVRDLMVRWRTEIKQTDSVVGDQYTICFGALKSLDAWARSVEVQAANQNSKNQIYDNQKKLCDQVIANSTSIKP